MQLHPPPNALPVMEALDHGETLKAKSLLANMTMGPHFIMLTFLMFRGDKIAC